MYKTTYLAEVYEIHRKCVQKNFYSLYRKACGLTSVTISRKCINNHGASGLLSKYVILG